MTLGEFKQQLKDMLKRGDSLDEQIPGFIRRAARWIEQNHTLQYMRRQIKIDVDGDSTEIDLPEGMLIKTIEYVVFPQVFDRTGSPLQLRKGELSDVAWDSDYPTMFY